MEDLFDKSFNRSKDSSNLPNLSFLEQDDVSEHAQIIGYKFEKVIKEFDLGEKLNPLMKHVIYLLEQIDLMIKEKEELQTNLNNLESQLQQYRFESKECRLEKLRCQNEFEQIEDTFRSENAELLNLISKLKDDNLKLRNLLNKEENFKENEKEFQENIISIENFTQNLLVKEKVKNLQKELDTKNENFEQVNKKLDQEKKKVETLNKQLQKLKEENLILNQQIDFKNNEYRKQTELTKELKSILTIAIKDHLDEQDHYLNFSNESVAIANNLMKNELRNKEYIEREKSYVSQLQNIQKLVEILSVSIGAVNSKIDISEFDKIKFQENLKDKLQKLEEQQEQQSKRLTSSQNSTPIESPKFCSLESNSNNSSTNKSPKHLLQTEPPQSKFTLNEIRNIILERNNLKSQVKYLEKQLFSLKKEQFNRKDDDKKENDIDKKNKTKNNEILKKDNFSVENFKKLAAESKNRSTNNENKRTRFFSLEPADDFLPVQGPINKEPDEKLYPFLFQRKNNSILKFFPLLKINRAK